MWARSLEVTNERGKGDTRSGAVNADCTSARPATSTDAPLVEDVFQMDDDKALGRIHILPDRNLVLTLSATPHDNTRDRDQKLVETALQFEVVNVAYVVYKSAVGNRFFDILYKLGQVPLGVNFLLIVQIIGCTLEVSYASVTNAKHTGRLATPISPHILCRGRSSNPYLESCARQSL